MRSRCDSHRVTFDLESFALGIEAKAAIWTTLGVVRQLKPISPNYGKPVVMGGFESATWIGDMTVWITGEAELVTIRVADGWRTTSRQVVFQWTAESLGSRSKPKQSTKS